MVYHPGEPVESTVLYGQYRALHFLLSHIGQMLNRSETEHLTETQAQDFLKVILRQTQSVEV